MYRTSAFEEYLQEVKVRVLRITIAIAFTAVFCMTFSIGNYYFAGYKIPMPYPDPSHNLATQVTHAMTENLLPKNVKPIQVTPQGAFVTQFYVAILLGIILSFPITVKELVSFLTPALYQSEKEILKKITLPSIGLFTIGCIFSYSIVIPNVLNFLYKYGESIGVSTFFNISDFVPFVLQLLVVFGVCYQLPLIMWAITAFKMVEPDFWRNNLRYVIIVLIVFAALITPDGSGITMWFVAGPMLLLYVVGMVFTERHSKRIVS
jgi:sec-independent protein translocase protein TatC